MPKMKRNAILDVLQQRIQKERGLVHERVVKDGDEPEPAEAPKKKKGRIYKVFQAVGEDD